MSNERIANKTSDLHKTFYCDRPPPGQSLNESSQARKLSRKRSLSAPATDIAAALTRHRRNVTDPPSMARDGV
jgi:hypothetical protein